MDKLESICALDSIKIHGGVVTISRPQPVLGILNGRPWLGHWARAKFERDDFIFGQSGENEGKQTATLAQSVSLPDCANRAPDCMWKRDVA